MRISRRIFILFILILLVVLVLPSVQSGWKGYSKDDANTGVTDANPPTGNVTTDWVYEGDFTASSPAVVDDVVYVGGFPKEYLESVATGVAWNKTSYIYSLNSSTGNLIWRLPTEGGIWSSPEYEGGIVYIGTLSGVLYAVNTMSGEKIWEFKAANPIFSSPTVSRGKVYFGGRSRNAHEISDGNFYFYAVDAADRKLIWKKEMEQGVYGSPAVVDDTVYIGSQNGTLYSIDGVDGDVNWRLNTTGNSNSEDAAVRNSLLASPTVSNDTVYVASYTGIVYAINRTTGESIWKVPTGSHIASSPAVTEENVYIGNYDGRVVSIDRQSGSINWNVSIAFRISKSSPAVANGVVILGSIDGVVYAINSSTGSVEWEYNVTKAVLSSPALKDEKVYFTDLDGVHSLTKKVSNENISNQKGNPGNLQREPEALAKDKIKKEGGVLLLDRLMGTVMRLQCQLIKRDCP